ncbi:MAG: DUF1295 domain-containing protein [Brevinemataceae bacterium]
MQNYQFFNISLMVFTILPVIVFYLLTCTNMHAPYGKFASTIWGKWSISAKWGWIIMESPSSIIFLTALLSSGRMTSGTIALFLVWQFHYFYRSFIYPLFTNHSKVMPVSVLLSAFSFQVINTYFQSQWVFYYSPVDMYDMEYLKSWHFIVGLMIFLIGSFINRQSDRILKKLRNPGETEYKIPYGGMYKYVSCPNYLGEIVIWCGWAVMLNSWVGLSFVFWTIANLVPRALKVHHWYLQKFPDYPKDRKAVIPFIW